MQEHPETPPEWEDNSTPESRAAWKEFYETNAVANAQSRFTAREQELQPLRDLYNNEMTKARLKFQEETHAEMMKLTAKLRELEKAEMANVTAEIKDIDGTEHPGT